LFKIIEGVLNTPSFSLTSLKRIFKMSDRLKLIVIKYKKILTSMTLENFSTSQNAIVTLSKDLTPEDQLTVINAVFSTEL
jgi:hypothetical protein